MADGLREDGLYFGIADPSAMAVLAAAQISAPTVIQINGLMLTPS